MKLFTKSRGALASMSALVTLFVPVIAQAKSQVDETCPCIIITW